ncbi:DUF4756 family protein [Klebsiella pneumoniae]|uniref:DUF4756 family protein n=1 Tax=Klebsiella pneumoniae TaxID=573 RepID=UPI0037462602
MRNHEKRLNSRQQNGKLRLIFSPGEDTVYEIKKYRSAHATLRRLDKKRQSLLDSFIGELNPISYSAANTAAKSSGNFDLINERILYRKAIEEKSDAEIIALVIKQRTEAALAFQRSVEMSLEQLSSIASDFESSNKSRRKMSF